MKRTNDTEANQEAHLKVLQTNPNMAGAVQTQKAILAAAGFTPTIVKKAVQRLNESLDANKVRFAVSGGQVIDSIKVADTDCRLKACNLVFSLAGLSKGEDSSGKLASVNVQIVNYAAPSKDNAT